MPIDKAKIEEWKALAAKATPGPWRVAGPAWSEPTYIEAPEPDLPEDPDLSRVVFGPETSDEGEDADRDFILAAREAVPALLAEREEMLSVLREVEWGGARGPRLAVPRLRRQTPGSAGRRTRAVRGPRPRLPPPAFLR